MNFQDIKKFPHCSYKVTVEWSCLERTMDKLQENYNCNFNPDFQRGHVWTREQQSRYCEYILRGGTSGRDIYCNCPNWEHGSVEGDYVLVDGKQRIQAVLSFLDNKISVFGHRYKDFSGHLRSVIAYFNWHVAALETRKDILEWYLNFNAGGTVHSKDELDKVEKMILECNDL
jgi:hypothetical protein